MPSDGGKPWTAPAKFLVLYRTPSRWRFAIYNEVGIIDGALDDLPVHIDPERAQSRLLTQVAGDTDLSYEATWRQDKEGWWSADLAVVTEGGNKGA